MSTQTVALPTSAALVRDETHTIDGVEYRFLVTLGRSLAGTDLHTCWVRRTDTTYRADEREFSATSASAGSFEAVIAAIRHIVAETNRAARP